jgi:two-component system, LuxR family, sensor kinase FixL
MVHSPAMPPSEATLQEREARLRSILDTAPDAIIVIDDRGIMESFSPAAERLFGLTAAEAIGKNVNVLMPSPYHERHDAYIQHYLDTGERRIIGIGRIVVGQRKDGSTFPMELAVGDLSANEIACALIPMMARGSMRPKQRPDTLMHDR